MDYYNTQLERINLDTNYAPTVVISDSEGNKTNAMTINSESAKVFINFFEQFLPRKIEFKRINNDVNGNPRYVCHFLELANDYPTALKRAKELGGRKYDNMTFGGGIVFQSYNIESLERKIIELTK